MKNRWRNGIWVLLLIIALTYPVYSAEAPKLFQLTILHNNDFHGYEPTNLARQATLVNQIRAQEPNVLFLNAGDVFTRGKLHQEFYGELEFAELNVMGVDAFTLGNNEFKATGQPDTSQSYLFARLKQASFPILCANVVQSKDGSLLPGVKPYIVKTVAGVRIGIFGVTANRTATYKQTQGLGVNDQLEAAKQVYPAVAGASDIVIALTHIGFDIDQKLAVELPGLAVIVGGDSHTLLREPVVVGGIPIVQAGGEEKQFLGRLDLTFELVENKWKLKQYKGVVIPIDGTIPMDPKVKEILDGYLMKIQKPAA